MRPGMLLPGWYRCPGSSALLSLRRCSSKLWERLASACCVSWPRPSKGLTAAQPLVLVLEDLHWSDYSTLECVWLCSPGVGSQRCLLVLGTYRPEDVLRQGNPSTPGLCSTSCTYTGTGPDLAPDISDRGSHFHLPDRTLFLDCRALSNSRALCTSARTAIRSSWSMW